MLHFGLAALTTHACWQAELTAHRACCRKAGVHGWLISSALALLPNSRLCRRCGPSGRIRAPRQQRPACCASASTSNHRGKDTLHHASHHVLWLRRQHYRRSGLLPELPLAGSRLKVRHACCGRTRTLLSIGEGITIRRCAS